MDEKQGAIKTETMKIFRRLISTFRVLTIIFIELEETGKMYRLVKTILFNQSFSHNLYSKIVSKIILKGALDPSGHIWKPQNNTM